MLLTIVICTYNRSQFLYTCLRSLQQQLIEKKLFEVLVIDNNSEDDTFDVAQSYRTIFPHFRLIKEPKQGLSHARNRGWQEAKGDYVAYIDDDAKAHHDWISEILRFIREHPEIQVFGGPYYRYSMEPLPEWFPEEYGTYTLGNETRPLKIPQEWINGSNMVFSKRILQHYGGFNPALGMRGDELGYGEETELTRQMASDGHILYYSASIKVDHLLASYKISLGWLLKSEYRNGYSIGKMHRKESSLRSFLLVVFVAFRGAALLFIFNKMPIKRRLYYSYRSFFSVFGELRGKMNM